jgi:hypothetical protein
MKQIRKPKHRSILTEISFVYCFRIGVLFVTRFEYITPRYNAIIKDYEILLKSASFLQITIALAGEIQ